MTTTPPVSFSVPQRVIHWVMVLMIAWQYISSNGFDAARAARRAGAAADAGALALIQSHAVMGIAILVLAVVRLCLRFIQGVPEEPAEEPAFFQFAAKAGHVALYALMFLLPITGMAAMYGDIDIAGDFHGDVLQNLLLLLIAIHVAAALVHQFYWKTNVLARMTRGV